MISAATAQRIAIAVGKVMVRQLASRLAGPVVEIGVDLAIEVADALGQEDAPGDKRASMPEIVEVIRDLSPKDIRQSIDKALASPDLRALTEGLTSREKEGLRERAVASMSEFDLLFARMDAEEAREEAARLERLRQEREAERLRREAELRERLAPLKAQLMESLQKRDYERARTQAALVLQIAPGDRDALEADRRIDRKLKDRFRQALAACGAILPPLIMMIFLARFAGLLQTRDWSAPLGSGPVYQDTTWVALAVVVPGAVVLSFVVVYAGWPVVRWWKLRRRR